MINKCDNSSPGSAAQKNSEPEQHPREVSQSGHAKDLDKDDPTTNDLVIAASSDSDASEASDNNFTHATRPSAPRRLTFYSKTEGFHEQVELNNLTRFGDMKTTCFSCGKTVKRKDGRSNELECGHVQCIPCLERKFKQAIKDPAAMPAVCCTNEPIPLTLMALCDLPPNFREDFTRKMVEYGRKRISCPVEECLADVQLETAKYRRGSDGSIVVTCDVCHTQICCDCKNEKHFSSCIQDTGTRKLLTLLEAERVIQIVDLDAAEQGRQGRASARRQSRIGNTCWHCNKAYNWNTFEVAQCGHSFCHPCLLGWFLVGLVLPQHNPPRCCNLEIGLACYRRILVNPWLNSAWLAQHEIAETGSWTCPTGAHVPKNLYITSTAPAVWKPRVQCEGCGPNHGIYCIRCKAKWHRTECWEFRSIEELERRLWQVDIIDESFLQQLSAGISYERKLRSGDKVSQFHRAQKFLDCRTEAQQVIRQEIPRPSAVQTEYPQAGALSESDWEEEDEEEEDEARDWEYAPYSPRGYGHDEWHDPYARNRMRGGHWADEVDTY
ncbi:uncharacterized protein B0I36DRAFT_133206 [Microdochium trichocladiopsis]|uniref:RING-type domain-containing protein n=1 Tax=Microdochium trichocladiopsis TaxID=1682393 RepID=A0A9P9BPP5_9PEZI|nr:uncharacterized protein B0I36DRAFT_133206 [Microdochium trichocladiopsis]KAH7029484.1 hypothetical protein B0I36DRAFT_133206 [Microdochium trichocladiopsis]